MPPHGHLAELWKSIQRICDEVGGRCAPCGKQNHVRIVDCPMWTARASAMLRVSHPNALMTVESSAASLSGYVMLITEPLPPLHRIPRILMAALGLLMVLGGTALVHAQLADEQQGLLYYYYTKSMPEL